MTASKISIEFICEICDKKVIRFKRSDSKFRFCSTKCAIQNAVEEARKVDRNREKNPAWRGGIRMAQGYRFILKPDHPRANDKGYVQEHRLVMEKHLDRYLSNKERIHHINGKKTDNRLENLELMSSQSDHIKEHIKNGSINLYYWKGRNMSIDHKIKMSLSHKQLWKDRKSRA